MKEIKIDISKSGYVSLVGFIKDKFPMKHGNYFSKDEHHILNMWYENLKHLVKTGVIEEDAKLDAMEFGDGVVITDERIPKEYLNKKMCFTGARGTIGPKDELYKFFYKEFSELDCMCNEEAGYVSLSICSGTMGDYPMKLASGYCSICRREIYTNHNKEITKDEYDVLHKEFNNLAWPGKIITVPYTMVQTAPVIIEGSGINIKDKKIKSRYGIAISDNFYKKFNEKDL
jgi:hypothetical protein